MSKQHRDFVTYVRNGVEINALVAFSRAVFTSATQTAPASSAEHLTVVYLDPNVGGGVPTGEALRNSIKIQMDVPPLTEGLVNGWFDSCRECGGGPCNLNAQAIGGTPGTDNPDGGLYSKGTGPLEVTSDEIASQLFDEIKNGEDLVVPEGANLGLYFKVLSDIVRALKTTNNSLQTQVEQIAKSLEDADKAKTEVEAELVEAKATIAALTSKESSAGDAPNPPVPPDGNPSAADLDAVAEEQKAKEDTEDSTPPPSTAESMAAQDEHDRATGNVNELGQTPNEAFQAEQSALKPTE